MPEITQEQAVEEIDKLNKEYITIRDKVNDTKNELSSLQLRLIAEQEKMFNAFALVNAKKDQLYNAIINARQTTDKPAATVDKTA